jgi:uncharacterized membrane protein YbhN (UPF0104 family)
MQVKDKSSIRRKKFVLVGVFVKVSITLTCIYFLVQRFKNQSIDLSQINWSDDLSLIISITSILMLLNWYLEAVRWKISLASFEVISIKESWKAVLGGLTLNWVLPFTSGDFAARIISRKDKYQTISAVVLNRSIMLFLTVIFGIYSLYYFPQSLIDIKWIYMLLLILGTGLFFFFHKRINRFIAYFHSLKKGQVIKMLLISVFRYALFTFQFYLLLTAFNPEVSFFILTAGIGWIFLARSIIPHILGGVGLREAASVVFFSSIVTDLSHIVIPVLLIWLINTVIPSIVGLGFIWKSSFLRTK